MNGNLTDRAYVFVHDKLTGGQLPAGSRLSNRAVAKELGVSLTPVRGAFNRLISEGLLDYHPGLGVFVPDASRREIEEIYEFRETLECAAVTKASGRLSQEALEDIQRVLDEGAALIEELEHAGREARDRDKLEKWRLADGEFHVAYLRAAGNRRMLQAVEDLRVRAQVVCHRLTTEPFETLIRTQQEHCRILDALRRGDAEEARRVMAEHVRNGRRLALEAHDMRRMKQPRQHYSGPHRPKFRGGTPRQTGETLATETATQSFEK